MILTPAEISQFQDSVWVYYRKNGRDMPWRTDHRPYYVLVSELMLQQTQVSRVIPKFEAFITQFPGVSSLAAAPLAQVLQAWSGLGYNRRAKFLHAAARQIHGDEEFPTTLEGLMKLPGVGANTAGAIMNYAFNIPTVFVETNIRSVYLHHFFDTATTLVDDREIKNLVAMTLDSEHPREWYWALMDYGSYLKRTSSSRLDQSKHYKKQSPLRGSLREMRGRIIKQLATAPRDERALRDSAEGDERFDPALQSLQREGMIEQVKDIWCLTGHEEPS